MHLKLGTVEPTTPSDLSKMKLLLNEVLDDEYTPDIIISWESTNQFLQEIYPTSLFLNTTLGLFSRSPFPETCAFDPNGVFKNSFLHKFSDELKAIEPSEKATNFMDSLREHFFTKTLIPNNPFKDIDFTDDGNFKYTVLLPLQVSDYFAFNELCDFESQYDFLTHVLDNIDPNIRVIVTEHTTFQTTLNKHNLPFLKQKYPNFYHNPDFNQYPEISQFLLAQVDGVITVSSSIGLQAMLLNKPCFVLSNSYLVPFADGTDVQQIQNFLDHNKTKELDNHRDAFLHYLFTHYYILSPKYLENGEWFFNFLSRSLEQFRNNKQGCEFYERIDTDSNILRNLLQASRPLKSNLTTSQTLFDTQCIKIDKADIVSFDVFDTLIFRTFMHPIDVFKHMNSQVRKITDGVIPHFHKIRTFAEDLAFKRALKQQREDITFDQIYEVIQEKTLLPQEIVDQIKQLEVDTELETIYPRQVGIRLLDYAKQLNKTIILTSDMYLPREVFMQILSKNGIDGFDELYISSEVGLKKTTGNLFKFVLEDLGASPKQMVHIGDNPKGDIQSAKAHEIDTIFLPKSLDLMQLSNEFSKAVFRDTIQKENSLHVSEMISIMANRHFSEKKADKESFFLREHRKIGYFALGPICIGFATWLYRQAQKDGIKHLYFLSRDGKIFKTVFDVLFPSAQYGIKTSYVYASRQINKLASIKTATDIVQAASTAEISKPTTMESILELLFSLDSNLIPTEVWAKYGFRPQQMIDKTLCQDTFTDFLLDIQDLIFSTLEKGRKEYVEYLEDMGLHNDHTAVVDIGYAGTMQKTFCTLLNKEISGYYFITFNEAFNVFPDTLEPPMKGYVSNLTSRGERRRGIFCNVPIYESLICTNEGSFLKITKNSSGAFVPHFTLKVENCSRDRIIPRIHRGVTDLVHDLLRYSKFAVEDMHFSPVFATAILDEFLAHPPLYDIALLENIFFDDVLHPESQRVTIPSVKQLHLYDSKLILWKSALHKLSKHPQVIAKKEERGKIIPIPDTPFYGYNSRLKNSAIKGISQKHVVISEEQNERRKSITIQMDLPPNAPRLNIGILIEPVSAKQDLDISVDKAHNKVSSSHILKSDNNFHLLILKQIKHNSTVIIESQQDFTLGKMVQILHPGRFDKNCIITTHDSSAVSLYFYRKNLFQQGLSKFKSIVKALWAKRK